MTAFNGILAVLSLQKMRYIGYSYKDGRDKPDLFRQSINKSLNLIGKEVSLKYDVSSATKVDLGEYLWETPQYWVHLFSSVKADSVYVRAGMDCRVDPRQSEDAR